MKLRRPLWIPLVLAGALAAVVVGFRSPAPRPGAVAASPDLRTALQLAVAKQAVSLLSLVHPGAFSGGTQVSRPQTDTVRVPAVRDGHDYGWIQLPRGTAVDLLGVEGGTLRVRYDGTVLRMPHSAVLDGAVSLRKPRVAPPRI